MMKKKTSTPSILRPLTLEWVTRHFFLFEDGKMIYAREGASVNPDEMVLLCNNISTCHIDRANASDMGKKKIHVANSFYITVPMDDNTEFAKTHTKRTLLVTHGPDDFRKWIATFRRLRATVNMEVDEPRMESSKKESDIPKHITPKNAVEVSALNMSDARFGDSTLFDDNKSKAIDDEERRVGLNRENQFIAILGTDEKIKVEMPNPNGGKSVSFEESSANEVMTDGEQLSETSGDDAEKKVVVSFSEVKIAETKVINDVSSPLERRVSFKTVKESAGSAEVIGDAATLEQSPPIERKVSFRTVRELVDRAEVIDDAVPLEKKVSFRKENDSGQVAEDGISEPPSEHVLGAAAAVAAAADVASDKCDNSLDANEGVLYPTGCKGAKIFAFGDSLDELSKALKAKQVLHGIVLTSLEEILDDATYSNTIPHQSLTKLKAFSIEFLGKQADPIKAEKFEQHLSEVISFCKSTSNLHDLHPIRCGDGQKARDEIVSVLQVIEDGNEEDEEKEVTTTTSAALTNFEHDSSSGLTAYKYFLETQDEADIPNGSEVLQCVRQQMGVPYNWVLYEPSKTDLVVEDAGSGGVIEMTKVLHECYNDRVLFGLARVSFMGETFGRRQIWFALEWSGENCTSVKMMRQLRDCATEMNERIGDRSFTMTNVSSTDMSPDAVCAWVKRSCDVTDFTLSVESMNLAYLEEQKVIKEYYEKLAEKEAAIRLAKETKRKEQLRKERLRFRQETRESEEPLRKERKEKWTKMNVPDILKDLGDKESLTGWLLLEIEN